MTHAGRTKASGAVLAADTRSKTMKRMMMSAASVLALAIAGPALAQSVSTVNQSNTGNRAHVDQTASLSGGDSLINQSGANNPANVSPGADGSGDRKSVV